MSTRYFALALGALIAAAPAYAGSSDPVDLGRANVRAGAAAIATPQAATTTTGAFAVSFAISIESHLTTDHVITCSVFADLIDTNTGTIPATVSSTGVATRDGKKATCQVKIPYSWGTLTTDTYQVDLTYNVNGLESVTSPRTTAAAVNPAPFALPANGVTTTLSYSVVM